MLAIVLATLVLLGVDALPSWAVTTRLTIGTGTASCPAGYVCLWTLNNFTGNGYAFFNSETDYSALPYPFDVIDNNSWSFYNHGNTDDIAFYRNANYGGPSTFILCKGVAVAQLPVNSDVDPPDTAEPGEGWRDSITSHHFGVWC
jgi:hypothetical protein